MCLEYIMHPISVARLVMEKTPHIILVGDGALQFALANGFKKENLLTPESEKAWKEWLKKAEYKPWKNQENSSSAVPADSIPGNKKAHDTIGMLAMDANGNLSGACTTSGLPFKMHGRVGDSPVIGAGLYVDNEIGAATATGVGEEMIRIAGAHTIVEMMRHGASPEEACKEAIQRIVKRNTARIKDIQCSFLAMNKKGEHAGYSIHPDFTYAVRNKVDDKIEKPKSMY
jgi:N4-(beta-N-acetylglucosaminyl)-L-asparaginase